MFPNIPANQIAFDLSRTRNVEATIEKLLSGTTLPSPPQDSRFAAWNQPRQAQAEQVTKQEPAKDDLLKRYKLEHRKDEQPKEQSYSWSKNRAEREATLKKRKEDAILAARRKLLEQDSTTT